MMQEWWTLGQIAEFNFRGLWSNVEQLRLIIAAENWQQAECEWPSNPDGFWRRGNADIEYRLELIVTQASFLALARKSDPSNPARILCILRGSST